MDIALAARPIKTIPDVDAVFNSPVASFVELMDCVAVAKAAGDWERCRHAAERAFAETKVQAPTSVAHLSGAAAIVIESYFKSAGSLGELSGSVDAAGRWLRDHRSKLDDANAADVADDKTRLLAELHVLLSAPEPEAKVRLCARLRKVDRADLGVEAVRPVANDQRDNVPALTTLGAAYCDMGEFERAEKVLRAALTVAPRESRALVALSRVLQECGRPDAALRQAKLAFSAEANKYTAHRLLAAAAEVRDVDAFDEALEEVERAAEAEAAGPPDVYLLLLAAEALLSHGRTEEISDVVQRVMSSRVILTGADARRFAALKRAARAAAAPTLFDDQSFG